MSDRGGGDAEYCRLVTEDEELFVRQELMTDPSNSLVYMVWIRKVKREKVEERLLVLTRFRVFTVKKGMMGKKNVRRNGHYFELREVKSTGKDSLALSFGHFYVDIRSTKVSDILFALRLALRPLQRCQPHFLVMDVPESMLMPLPDPEPSHEEDNADGFNYAFKAWCNYYSAELNLEVIRQVDDCAFQGTTILNLSECIQFDEAPAESVLALAAALKRNEYFTAIVLHNTHRKDAIAAFAETMQGNTKLEDLCLSGVEATEGWTELGQALVSNEKAALRYLDLSNNNIGEKGVQAIARGLRALKKGLISLFLYKCHLNSKGIAALFTALEEEPAYHKSLKEVNLSHNRFDSEGSQAFAKFVRAGSHGCNLRTLQLNHCALDIPTIMEALKEGASRLTRLDLSHNKFDEAAARAVAQFLNTTRSLTTVDLSCTRLNRELLEIILPAIVANRNITKVKVDLGDNELGADGAEVIAEALKDKHCNIATLRMNDVRLGRKGMIILANALKDNTSLTKLTVSRNLRAPFEPKAVTKVTAAVSSAGSAGARDSGSMAPQGGGGNNNNSDEESDQVSGMTSVRGTKTLSPPGSPKSVESPNIKIEPSPGSMRSSGPGRYADICRAFGAAVRAHPTLESLTMRGSERYFVGRDMVNMLELLATASKLNHLDISGNRMGDAGAAALADMLAKNSTIRNLAWDDNETTFTGLQKFRNAIKSNTSLCEMGGFPIDLARIMGSVSSKEVPRLQQRVRDLLNSINDTIKSNGIRFQILEDRANEAMTHARLSKDSTNLDADYTSFRNDHQTGVHSSSPKASHPLANAASRINQRQTMSLAAVDVPDLDASIQALEEIAAQFEDAE